MCELGASASPAEIVARRRWTAAQKSSILSECAQPGNSVARTARKHGVSPSQIYTWRKLMREGGEAALQANEAVVSVTEVINLEKKVAELERILGKKTHEIEILKAAVDLGRKKKLISQSPLSGIEDFQ